MAIVGYARVSTLHQKLDLQTDALKLRQCDKIFSENVSGVAAERPQFKACMEYLRSGDVLVVWKLDRLARSTKELFIIIEQLQKRNISFVSIREELDTDTPSGKLVFGIYASVIEFERSCLLERASAGLKAAKTRGRVGGRPSKLSPAQIADLCQKYHTPNYTSQHLSKIYGVSTATIFRIVKRQKLKNKKNDTKVTLS